MIASVEVFFLVLVVLGLYYWLSHQKSAARLQNLLLLASSYILLAFWDYRSLFLVLVSSGLTFWTGYQVGNQAMPARKFWLVTGVAGNLGILGVFKWSQFFIENAERVFHLLGIPMHPPVLYIIIPVGISFYTFQAISYIIDIYKGTLPSSQNLLDFALYLTYFPKLTAGPLERGRDFFPQIAVPRLVKPENIQTGLGFVLLGLFKKIAIADPLSPFVDPIFLHPNLFSTPEILRAVLFFTVQIYCDFSGYTDIARGMSFLFGLQLTGNFKQPYWAEGIAQFWRRWHISLSNWFRDYVFFPLERKRRGYTWWPQVANIGIVFLLTGFWHGASFNFLVWGLIHGVAIAAEVSFLGKWLQASWKPLRHVYTMIILIAGWIFFKSPGVTASIYFYRQLFSWRGMDQMIGLVPSMVILWIPIILIDWIQLQQRDELAFLRWQPFFRGMTIALMLLCIFIGSGIRAPFIYSQF